MSLQERLAAALDRIAPATSTVRIRAIEADRAERLGDPKHRDYRLEMAVRRLEAVADELEKALT